MILLKKAMRSIWRSRGSFGACILLISLGIASLVGFTLSGIQLTATMESMYETQRFGDAFARIQGIPADAVRSLARTEGIREVTPHTVVSTTVLHEGNDTLTLQLLSCDADDIDPLNAFELVEGELPKRGEILVSQNYYMAQGLQLGDRISLLADGRQARPIVSGVVTSPDYINEVGEGMTGNGYTAGYAYMPAADLAALANSGGLYNYLVLGFTDGTRYRDMEPIIEDILKPYGLKSLYDREEHPSHSTSYESFESLGASGGMMATIFIIIAVLVLYILLRRIIEQDRGQIGTLKAFGFSDLTILLLYMGYGVLIGLVGGIVGALLGLLIAEYFTATYLTILFMPAIPRLIDWGLIFQGTAIALAGGVAGSLMGAYGVLKLSPAESMRPASPPAMKRKRGRQKPSLLPTGVAMALRNIARRKFRSSFVAMGLAVAYAILTFMSSYGGVMDEMAMTQFSKIQLYDIKMGLREPRGLTESVGAAGRLTGVREVEGVLEITVRMYREHRYEDMTLTGLPRDSELQRIYDTAGRHYHRLPAEGAIISQRLAEKIGADLGDTLAFTTNYTGDTRHLLTITGIVGENMGYTAYVDLSCLCRMLGIGDTVNTLLMRADDPLLVRDQLDDARNKEYLYVQQELRQSLQEALDMSLGVNVAVFGIMGFGIAFAIIMSSASIAMSERAREYATLRVLGMGPGQIGRIMIGEYLLLCAGGFLPGVAMSYGLRWLMSAAMGDVDSGLSLSMYIAPTHFIVGGLICLGTMLIANLSSIGKIARLDMTDVLKERE